MFKVNFNPELMLRVEDIAKMFGTTVYNVKRAVAEEILPLAYAYTYRSQKQVWGREKIEKIHADRGGKLPDYEKRPEFANFLSLTPPRPVVRRRESKPVKPEHLVKVKLKSDWQ